MTSHQNPSSDIRHVDQWSVLKVVNEHNVFYRLLTATSDDFFDYWRLNSGIVKFFVDDDYVDFHGHSGSIYRCKLVNEGFSDLTRSVLTKWQVEITDPTYSVREMKFNDFIKEWEIHKPWLS